MQVVNSPNNLSLRRLSGVRLMVEAALEDGLPIAQVLAGSGIGEAGLGDPEAMVEGHQEWRVIENLVNLRCLATLPIRVGMRVQSTTMGVFGFALMSCETLRQAYEMGQRFPDLGLGWSSFHLEEESGGDARFMLECEAGSPEVRRFVLDRDFAALATFLRAMLGESIPLKRLWIPYSRQAPVSLYSKLVSVVPEFDKPIFMAVLDRSILDRPLPNRDFVNRQVFEAACLEQSRQQQNVRRRLDQQVKQVLREAATVGLSIEEVAARFEIHPRTLRRRLAEHGVSFRELQDVVRHELAETMLREGALSTAAMASRLGYRNAHGFLSAYRRWTGRSVDGRQRSPSGSRTGGECEEASITDADSAAS